MTQPDTVHPAAPPRREREACPLVIVPCGSRKAACSSAPAGRLYTGSYHAVCRRAAAALSTPDRTLILSALHGLLPLDRIIAPYELRMGKPGSVTAGELRRQAAELDLVDEQQVIVLAGRAYATAALAVWPHAATPLLGVVGLGHQIAQLNRIAAGAPAENGSDGSTFPSNRMTIEAQERRP